MLFASGDLGMQLTSQQAQMRQAVDGWDPDQLLATAEADVIAYLVDRYGVTCPVLHPDQAQQLPVSEEVKSVAGMFSGEAFDYRMTKIVVAVPFDGEKEVFALRPSQSTLNPPSAEVADGELRLTWTGDQQTGTDPSEIRRYFDGLIAKIEQYLSWSRNDIDRFNTGLRTQAISAVAERKAKLLADRELETGVGFPVRQRPDAAKLAFPVTRRKIDTPRRPTASGPFKQEPFLDETQYEQALATLINARNSLERSPSMTAHLDEEKIRLLLLFFLNGQFEGAAAGEVFNAAGKTDILIRVGDRNIFIAECKIWKSPKTIRDALTQLLGYLTWRDTKAALLLFIRSGEPTTIISKSITEIEGHPNYKRRHGNGQDGERYDFVLHANGDPNQEIRLAFLPFALQDTQDQP